MNWSFVFLAQREDPEVCSELLELSIDRTVTKTRSEIFTNVKTGKSATRNTRGRQPLRRYAQRRRVHPPASSGTAILFLAKTVEWFVAERKQRVRFKKLRSSAPRDLYRPERTKS